VIEREREIFLISDVKLRRDKNSPEGNKAILTVEET